MINNKKILILDNIVIDKTLPKFSNNTKQLSDSQLVITSGFSGMSNISVNGGIFNKIKNILFNNFLQKKPKQISISNLKLFFENIKTNISELDYKNISEILSKYDSVLSNAKYNNQVALCEILEDYIGILKNELILTSSEFNKFLEEPDVVDFYNKASKHEKYQTGLCLTYIKNFVKIIPNEISELKIKADKLNVFDNYVILHYDYDNSSVADTKEEAEKKKDPIMFGVIRNSRRLYYIGDWIDVYCDLTLGVLIKTIGIESKQLNSDNMIPKV